MSFLGNPRVQRWMRVLFWLALIFALVMAVLPYPPRTPVDQMGDKFAHMLAFATLAGLGAVGFGVARRWLVAERLSFLGAMIEVMQSIPALNRYCDVSDWIADTLAIIVVMIVAGWILPRGAEPEKG